MKKRVAYIGLAYPLLYDYGNMAYRTKGDRTSSPNPIIESPLGLMILYDELLFLCRSVCPNNMRDLPYVKFVDEMYPDFYFAGALNYIDDVYDFVTINEQISFNDIVSRMNIESWRVDVHTHSLQIGDLITAGKPIKDNFIFDLYVFEALQKQYDENIELISNSYFSKAPFNGSVSAEFANRIVIKNIPNYLSKEGPYHECIESLRENEYLTDFRKWIIKKHNHLQYSEIDEVCEEVENCIEECRNRAFKEKLHTNSGFSCFTSTSSTLLKTGIGLFSPAISIMDAFGTVIDKTNKYMDVKSIRWQGFVMDAWEATR